MDRDNRWDRIEKAYKAIIEGNAEKRDNSVNAIKDSYKIRLLMNFLSL